MIEKLKALEIYEDGRYWAFLAIKINEIIDYLNATATQTEKQQTKSIEGLATNESKSDEPELNGVRILATVRQAREDMRNIIAVYHLERRVRFYTKTVRGRYRDTCVIKADSAVPNKKPRYVVGRATCSPLDTSYEIIGKIISLRRALGLDVPYEYTRMPQQKEEDKG